MGVGRQFKRLEANAGKAAPLQVARCIGFLATTGRFRLGLCDASSQVAEFCLTRGGGLESQFSSGRRHS
jgi:hypothetical protein